MNHAAAALARDFTPLSDMRAPAGRRLLAAQNRVTRAFHDLNGSAADILQVAP